MRNKYTLLGEILCAPCPYIQVVVYLHDKPTNGQSQMMPPAVHNSVDLTGCESTVNIH